MKTQQLTPLKTQQRTWILILILTVMGIGTLAWQQGRLARTQTEIRRLQAGNASQPAIREAPSAPPRRVDQAEPGRPSHDRASLQLEWPRTRVLAARTRRTEADAATARPQLEQVPTQEPGVSEGIAAPLAAMTQGVLEQRSQRQLARLQQRLDLNPFQTETIRQILERRARGMAETMKHIYSGKPDPTEIDAIREDIRDPEEQILAILTPDQQLAYAQMRAEERAETALRSANNEFLELRSTLDLRDDQEDRVFNILHDQARRQQFASDSDDPEPADPVEAMQRVMQRKLEALEGVLTADQLAGYQKQQELQLGFLKGMLARVQAAGARP